MVNRHDDQALDGNAAGGPLGEVFALDVTSAEFICDGCGVTAVLGTARVFGGVMGTVLRCTNCDAVLLRVTHTPAGHWLDMRGTRRLFVAV